VINVLVTGTGGGVGQSIVKALKIADLPLRIITADMHPLGAGIYRGFKGYLVPAARDEDFNEKIIGICNDEKIDIVFIGSDPELPVFAENKEIIERKTRAKVVVSSPDHIKIGNDKWETYRFLKDNNLPYPESSLPDAVDDLVSQIGYPLIVKPRGGSASRDVYVAKNAKELDVFINRVKNPIIQEYLMPDDEEYTSGVVMFQGKITGIITMKRELKGGNTYRAIVDKYDTVITAVENVAKKFSHFGPSNFQMRLTDRGPVTFEINPRFSGTTGIRAFYNFNEPRAVIEYLLHNKVIELKPKRGIVMRYMNEVYAPFEDYNHIIQKGKIEKSGSRIIDYF